MNSGSVYATGSGSGTGSWPKIKWITSHFLGNMLLLTLKRKMLFFLKNCLIWSRSCSGFGYWTGTKTFPKSEPELKRQYIFMLWLWILLCMLMEEFFKELNDRSPLRRRWICHAGGRMWWWPPPGGWRTSWRTTSPSGWTGSNISSWTRRTGS
jgi:hypothetical protein